MAWKSERTGIGMLTLGLALLSLAAAGCMHQVDVDSPELVGKWVAASATKTVLGSERLEFLDARSVFLSSGKKVSYVRIEAGELSIDGYDNLTYNLNGDRLEFVLPAGNILYQLIK